MHFTVSSLVSEITQRDRSYLIYIHTVVLMLILGSIHERAFNANDPSLEALHIIYNLVVEVKRSLFRCSCRPANGNPIIIEFH